MHISFLINNAAQTIFSRFLYLGQILMLYETRLNDRWHQYRLYGGGDLPWSSGLVDRQHRPSNSRHSHYRYRKITVIRQYAVYQPLLQAANWTQGRRTINDTAIKCKNTLPAQHNASVNVFVFKQPPGISGKTLQYQGGVWCHFPRFKR